MRIDTVKTTGAALETMRLGPVAFDLFLATGSARFTRSSGSRRTRHAQFSIALLNGFALRCHGGFIVNGLNSLIRNGFLRGADWDLHPQASV